MGPTLVAWSLILLGPERMFCLLVFNIGINCLTLTCWEITLLESELPSFLQVSAKLEGSFSVGRILSCHTGPPRTAVSLPCNYQLPPLLTQLLSYDAKALFPSRSSKQEKELCLRRQCSSLSDVHNWPWGYLSLWPWVKRWGHVHQSIATHYPNSQIGIEIQVQTVTFTFKWLLPYHLQ